MLSPARRKAIYSALAALGAVLVTYGLITQDQLAAWLQVASAALMFAGSVLAAKNTKE